MILNLPHLNCLSDITPTADEKVYKTLSSAGDFKCFVWFQHDFYDEERTNGQHKIVIRGSFVENSPLTDDGPIGKFVGHTSAKIVFVDCIFRDNGVDYKSNRDLRDCARWISQLLEDMMVIKIVSTS